MSPAGHSREVLSNIRIGPIPCKRALRTGRNPIGASPRVERPVSRNTCEEEMTETTEIESFAKAADRYDSPYGMIRGQV
jgi:hypothetical protein